MIICNKRFSLKDQKYYFSNDFFSLSKTFAPQETKVGWGGGGQGGQGAGGPGGGERAAYLLTDPASPGSNHGFSIFSEKILMLLCYLTAH